MSARRSQRSSSQADGNSLGVFATLMEDWQSDNQTDLNVPTSEECSPQISPQVRVVLGKG